MPSLLGVMTADGKERTTLATFRFIFAFGGSLVVLAAAEPLAGVFSRLGGTAGFAARLATDGGGIRRAGDAILFWLTFAWTRERIKPVTSRPR